MANRLFLGLDLGGTNVKAGVVDDQGNALAQVKGGRLRALAVSSLKRNPAAPDWPAISAASC